MRIEWDPAKDEANQTKHGISFAEASRLFDNDVEQLVLYDEQHSEDEERFISIGPIASGIVLVVTTEPDEETIRVISARRATAREVELFRDCMEGS